MGEAVLGNKQLLLSLVLFLFPLATGCSPNNDDFPLPSSTKIISTNAVEVPFPYRESSNGKQWILSRDTAGQNPVVQVNNEGTVVESFPANASSNTSIILDGQKYTVSAVTVNSDNKPGVVTLVKQ